eukprot:352854-Chlamydomonas_euryale.AAC.4
MTSERQAQPNGGAAPAAPSRIQMLHARARTPQSGACGGLKQVRAASIHTHRAACKHPAVMLFKSLPKSSATPAM